ncbi:MAG TPA: hypothetical protein VL306_02750 [Methylomirabilota bacterium]|nr:hypothetical protein [Methylomirabilota bacterium]
MDPKKKKIYIIIISVCVIGSLGIFLWGQRAGVAPATSDTSLVNPNPTLQSGDAAASGAPSADGVYPPPAVFPNNTKLDTSIIDTNSKFKSLIPYTPAAVDPKELGRDDPFTNY